MLALAHREKTANELSSRVDGKTAGASGRQINPVWPALAMRVQRKCACGGVCPKCSQEGTETDLPIQEKLVVSQPRDVYEREADRVADAVMRAAQNEGHPSSTGGQDQPIPLQSGAPPAETIQRQGPPGSGSSAPPTSATTGTAPSPGSAAAPSPSAGSGLGGSACPNYFDKKGPVSRQGPSALRLADCGCVWHGGTGAGPTTTLLTGAQQTQLQDLINQLQGDIPDLHSQIQSKNVQVTHAALPADNLGQMRGEESNCTMEHDVWFIFGEAGGDFAQGVFSSQADYDAAQLKVANMVPFPLIGLGHPQTRSAYVGVILIDLNQVGATTKTGFDTLKHESGHFVFEETFAQLRSGGGSSPALSPSLKAEASKQFGEQVETELDLITEFAAASVEGLKVGERFDPAVFAEEFDPRFGISGLYSETGDPRAPKGWGWRMLNELSLVDAKKKAAELAAQGIAPVTLETGFSLTEERRFFNLWLGELTSRKDADQWFQSTLVPLGFKYADVDLRRFKP